MKRRTVVPVAALCALLALALAAPAGAAAAPAFEVQASHSPATIHRGDESVSYSVTVKNTGPDPTSGAVQLSLGLPAGTLLNTLSGTGWSCAISTLTCTRSDPLAAGSSYPALSALVAIDPATAPDTLLTTLSACGGGASSCATGQDGLTMGSALRFELPGFLAGACGPAPASAPPGSTSPACEAAHGGDVYALAGGHPFMASTSFGIPLRRNSGGGIVPFEDLRDAVIGLPLGFVANPAAVVGGCRINQVVETTCPDRFAVGRAWVELAPAGGGEEQAVIYKVEPEKGYAAEFAVRPVSISPATVVLRGKVRPGDFGVSAFSPLPVQNPALLAVHYFSFCSYGARVVGAGTFPSSPACKQPSDPTALSVPLLTNPTRCNGQSDTTTVSADSYQHPGATVAEGYPDLSDPAWRSSESLSPPLTGCNQLQFEPEFEGRPTTDLADAPSGLKFNLHVPQQGLVEQQGRATPHLRRTVVTLPQGMAVNPSAANGLEACTPAQIGLLEIAHPGSFPIRFDGRPAGCPHGSKLGNVTVTSPLLDQTLQGSLYLAEPDDPATSAPGAENPFDSLLAVYLVLRNEDLGLSAKLAGKIAADPVTGQLTATFDDNPQLPFEELELEVLNGPQASLRTPSTCGPKATAAEFTPWSAPESGPPAQRTDSFAITTAPGGGRCAANASELPNSPRFSAGTVSPQAGAYSPFVMKLAREDGSQELKRIDAVLPPGLTGRLTGVEECSDARLALAQARSRPNEGALERSNPSCPAGSQVGTVNLTAGAGPVPFQTSGKAYLAGPYKGAPISLAIVTPAIAGPFDLGTVVVRNPLYVNPETAQVTVRSDEIPHILDGIPLDVRSIEVDLSRRQFTLNPTSCEPFSLTGTAAGLSSEAQLTSHFQVGNCGALAFKPKLKLSLQGATRRSGHPSLKAVLTYPKGGAYANVARAQVNLPHSEFIDQSNLNKTCTKPVLLAGNCPATTIYGKAKAWTPLLDQPLEGPVYLVGGYGYELPALVAELNGQIRVLLVGKVDSGKNHGIRNTFETVPDAPVEKFVLEMKGGKHSSLIENSENLCKKPQRAIVSFTAQNGDVDRYKPTIANQCPRRVKVTQAKGHGRQHQKKNHHRAGSGNRGRLAFERLLRAW